MDIVKMVALSILRKEHQHDDVIWCLYDTDGLRRMRIHNTIAENTVFFDR